MSQEEGNEWLEAVHELHRHSYWFQDKPGILFSFLWYASLKGDE